MKKRHGFRENLITALEVPRDLACRDAIITVTGKNQVVIENYRSILRYSRDEIVLLTLRGKVTIRGKRLEIPCYSPEEMQISGIISMILLEQ